MKCFRKTKKRARAVFIEPLLLLVLLLVGAVQGIVRYHEFAFLFSVLLVCALSPTIMKHVAESSKRGLGLNPIQENRNEMSELEFRKYVQNYFAEAGFYALTISGSQHCGADLILMKDGVRHAVQLKHSKEQSRVGARSVQELLEAVREFDCETGTIVTNTFYSKKAIELACQGTTVDLLDRYLQSVLKNRGEEHEEMGG